MAQAAGVTDRASLFLPQVLKRPALEIAIAGMHGHDAMSDASQKLQRIVPCEEGIAWIVIDSKMGMLNSLDQLAEDVHLLGELGILPEIVLVVIFDNQCDIQLFRPRQAGSNALRCESDARLARQFRAPLAAEDAAVAGAEFCSHFDPAELAGDLQLAKVGIGMGKVGAAAEHRDDHSASFHRQAKPWPLAAVSHFEKTGVPFQSVQLQRRGQLDPLRQLHRSRFAELLHEGLGKSRKLGHA